MIRRRTDYGRKGRERWQWRVTSRGRATLSGTCPTKACAVECARKAEELMKSGRPTGRITLAEAADRYAAEYLPRIPDSAPHYRIHLVYWRAALGGHFIAAVTPQMIAAHRDRLVGAPTRRNGQKHAKPRSPATVNRYLNTLASLYSWALSPDVALATQNPVRDVKRLSEGRGRLRWLSRPTDDPRAELERLLRACAESESGALYDLVVLLLGTGCREREILHLRRVDVRLSEGGFTIPAENSKTEEPRFVPLSGAPLEAVKRRLALPAFGNPYLFAGREGRPMAFPYRAWRTALRKAEIQDFRAHDLRHTHGSYLAMMGKTLPEIMAALGHKTPAVALRYVHLAGQHVREVNAEVNAQIEKWAGHALKRPRVLRRATEETGPSPRASGRRGG